MTHLPSPRGPLSRWVLGAFAEADRPSLPRLPAATAVLSDGDFQLALWLLYELHYRGFDGVEADLEWDPDLIAARRQLEAPFEAALRALPSPLDTTGPDEDVSVRLTRLIDADPSGELAPYLQRAASREEFLDFLRSRSIYHLKESDPQSFLLPRLSGGAKVALAELQYDEYGAGDPDFLHQELFADALRACGLSADYGSYLDETDALTLANNNAMSLFALNRRLRGAAMGHLAAFEATSSVPCRRIAAGADRLGLPAAAARYYDEHVEADAAHEQVAILDICGRAAAAEPELADDMLFGASVCLELDRLAAEDLLERWRSGPSLSDEMPRVVA